METGVEGEMCAGGARAQYATWLDNFLRVLFHRHSDPKLLTHETKKRLPTTCEARTPTLRGCLKNPRRVKIVILCNDPP